MIGSEPESTGALGVGGARLRYVVEGSGRPALVVGSAVYYPRSFSQQLRQELRLAFIDVRHFAEDDGSPEPEVTLDTYLDDIERVRASTGFANGIVIGHSHHGNLALEYAKRHHERVTHLVMIGSPPLEVSRTIEEAEKYWRSHASEARKKTLRDRLVALEQRALEISTPEEMYVARYLAEGPRYWYEKQYDAAFLWEGMPINIGAMKRFRAFFADGYEMSWDEHQMTAPVLVVMGEHDYAVPHTLWDEVRTCRDNLTYHLFDHSGHTPQLEEPERFDRVLLDWI
ncbi:MAG: alpha/beta hydrolase [Acidobacteria bacterium]|nr:alpha/beta hydrolase [Acidobacteriota bacterium]